MFYANEAEEFLEEHEQSALQTVLATFTAKGGTVIRLDKGTAPFQLAPGDMVFPACSGGSNRSQTLWNLLRPYQDKITLMPPHATRYGFDPYNGQANWQRIHRVKNHHRLHRTKKRDEFSLWAGIPKSKRFGWEEFEAQMRESEISRPLLDQMLEYYTHHYYQPNCPSGTRRVYITFAKNAHIHLYRLVQTNASLENVIVLFYPLEDLIYSPLPEWNTYPGSVKSYTQLSAMLISYLDFSRL